MTKTYKEVKEILMSLDKTQKLSKTGFLKRDNVISLSDLEKVNLYYFNHNTSYGLMDILVGVVQIYLQQKNYVNKWFWKTYKTFNLICQFNKKL